MSDSGYGTRDSGYSFDSFEGSKVDDDDDAYTDPGSLTFFGQCRINRHLREA